ncbi:hypothetical protein [Cyclobacterium plantarum]|uniref:hypothetical protein n=1 Tax=Cyclobacterium plantarum TaxID=2716263 RepID=UPI003F726609
MKYPCSFLIFTFLCTIYLSSCTSKLDAGNMDLEAWKKDRNGCLGLRIKDVEELQRIKNTFLASYNQEIIKTFGRPDRVELVDKSQSFFIYFLEPSDKCGVKPEKEPLKVLFRLNAISKVSEVTITSLNP